MIAFGIMAKKIKKAQKSAPKKARETVHDIYLAGLGALAAVGEGGAKLAKGAIGKGTKLAKTGKKKGKKGVKRVEANADAVAGWVDGRVQGVLERLGVPTRTDVHALGERLDALLEKVSRLEGAKAAPAPGDDQSTVYHVTPHDGGWQVLLEGADAPLAVAPTKKAALDAARAAAKAAQPSRIVAHRADGTIQTSYGYGAD